LSLAESRTIQTPMDLTRNWKQCLSRNCAPACRLAPRRMVSRIVYWRGWMPYRIMNRRRGPCGQCAGGYLEHQRERQIAGEHARQQVLLALRITSTTLQDVRNKVDGNNANQEDAN